MEQVESTNIELPIEELTKEEQVKEDRRTQAENMRLKKQIKAMQEHIYNLERFIKGE